MYVLYISSPFSSANNVSIVSLKSVNYKSGSKYPCFWFYFIPWDGMDPGLSIHTEQKQRRVLNHTIRISLALGKLGPAFLSMPCYGIIIIMLLIECDIV